jgi:2-polyprenyl-6-methoxyphenol hydroxylase-like FAD-dependent oxidoreductase
MLAMEGSRWIVSMGGWLGNHAPTDPHGFVEFARSLNRPDIYDVIKNAEPLTDAVKFVFPSNLRRRYDRLQKFPSNFLVMGDAMCSFNPLYGQGMSVATLEALALSDCLNTISSPDRVWRPFFKAAAEVIDTPWTIAAGNDFAFTGVTGPRPTGTGAVNWYLSRVHKAASVDRHVCRSFFDVANLLRPATALFAPSVVARVARACLAPTVPSRPTGVRLDSKGRLIETT